MSKKKRVLSTDPIFYVYALIDPFTRKPFYIGKGKKDRMYKHVNFVRKYLTKTLDEKFYKTNKEKNFIILNILKNNEKIIYKKLIKGVDEERALKFEVKMIHLLRKNNFNLTNITDGGEGNAGNRWKYTDEQKKRHSLRIKGEGNPFYGKHHSEKTKKKISNSISKIIKGKNNPFYGKHHSEKTKKYFRKKFGKRILVFYKQNFITIIHGKSYFYNFYIKRFFPDIRFSEFKNSLKNNGIFYKNFKFIEENNL